MCDFETKIKREQTHATFQQIYETHQTNNYQSHQQ
jgi:hypothetical protein